MANDFVPIDRGARFGTHLVELAQILRRAKELSAATLERMNHMRADNGSDGSPICTHFGLNPNGNASTVGEAARGVVVGVVTALDASEVTTMIGRVG